MRVLILYTELAGYFLACIRHLILRNPDTRILLIHYPVNPEAPFVFSLADGFNHTEYRNDKETAIKEQITRFEPEVILCSGWGNNFYLRIVRKYRSEAITVVFIDNQWHGSLKQHFLKLFSPLFLTKIFKYAWVPGQPQEKYALKLGFRQNHIFKGLYVADTKLFEQIGLNKLKSRGSFPKIIISVARYIAQKDLPTLWKAFILANKNTGNNWILKSFGYGELFDKRIQNPGIFHMGFKQPEEMEKYLVESGVYVLPSLFEPWGVAVHEMALAAMPMILSDRIGSVSMFLDSGNGFVFKAGDADGLQHKLESMMTLSDNELWEMAEKSHKKGIQLKLDDWVETFNKISGSCAE